MNPYRRAAMDLYYWKKSNNGSFKDMLFDLIAKADINNRARLMAAFPEHVGIYEEWCKSEDEELFLSGLLKEINKKPIAISSLICDKSKSE